jgi:Uma2 family endonuclease
MSLDDFVQYNEVSPFGPNPCSKSNVPHRKFWDNDSSCLRDFKHHQTLPSLILMVRVPLKPISTLPPLENGDRLTRDEFERRYAAMAPGKKAELIEGVVYMAAALRFRSHGQPHAHLTTWLGNYMVVTPGVELAIEPTVRLDLGNEPQPDVVLRISEECGGSSRLSQDDYIAGPPELAVEIAASSVAIDLGDKRQAYERNGIQEYLVWRVFERQIDWFSLDAGNYVKLPIEADGTIRSRVFPGLWLAVAALLAGDLATVLAGVNQGLATIEHGTFVEKLQQIP